MEETKRTRIAICMGSSCFARGNNQTLQQMLDYVKRHGLQDSVELKGLLCKGACSGGPNLEIDGTPYRAVEPGAILQLLDHHLRPPGGPG